MKFNVASGYIMQEYLADSDSCTFFPVKADHLMHSKIFSVFL